MSDQSTTGDPMASFGPNEWLVDELYERFLTDKSSVDKAWWAFFEDYHPQDGGASNGTKAEKSDLGWAEREGEGTARTRRKGRRPRHCDRLVERAVDGIQDLRGGDEQRAAGPEVRGEV